MRSEDVRSQAVEIHTRDADLFAESYRSDSSAIDSAFHYGREQLERCLEEVVSRLPPGARILDLGCGTGDLVKDLRDRGFDAVGVEPSPAMRARAFEILPEECVVDGSVIAIPHRDQSFDLVISIEVFRYLDSVDNMSGFREVARVLKAGGYFFGSFVNLFAADGFAALIGLRRLRAALGGREMEFHTEFETPGSLERKLRAAGFARVQTRGAMVAPLRIAYKVSPSLARRVASVVRPLDSLLTRAPGHGFAGHLLAIAARDGGPGPEV